MPIFEYACKTCNHQFEALVYGGEKAACPKCHGKKLAQQFSVFGVSAKESSGSALAWEPAAAVAIRGDRAPVRALT